MAVNSKTGAKRAITEVKESGRYFSRNQDAQRLVEVMAWLVEQVPDPTPAPKE